MAADGHPSRPILEARGAAPSLSDDEQGAEVLGVDLAVRADRDRGVGGAEGELQEEVLRRMPPCLIE